MSFYIDLEENNRSHNRQHDIQEHLGSDDVVINKTDWTPLHGGGQSFKSHTLVKVSDDRLVFKRSLSSSIFYGLTVLAGLITMGLSIFGSLLGMSHSENPLYGIAFGLLFVGVGVYLYTKGAPTINLDRKLKALWKGTVDAAAVINKSSIDGYTPLNKLHAVQVIEEFVSGNGDEDSGRSNSYYSYEVNLVMSDGKRVNVLDHGSKKAIDEDSKAIAALFDVPLWDGRRDDEEEEGYVNSWLDSVINIVMWGKTLFGFIVVGAVALSFYNMFESSKQEEKMLAAMTPKEAAVMAEKSTQELLARTKNGKISLPYIDTLRKRGAEIDGKDELGRTPLFYAVMQTNFDLLNTFMRAGADIDIKDVEGRGLKELLDPVGDKFLYYYIVDAELSAEAQSRGKQIISINRKYDVAGNMTYQKVNER